MHCEFIGPVRELQLAQPQLPQLFLKRWKREFSITPCEQAPTRMRSWGTAIKKHLRGKLRRKRCHDPAQAKGFHCADAQPPEAVALQITTHWSELQLAQPQPLKSPVLIFLQKP